MKNYYLLSFLIVVSINVFAQPELSSWVINIDGSTGFNDLPSNVQSVDYTSDNVFISCSCIPGYDIGPWVGNPNTAANQDFCFKLTRHPVENTGNLLATPMGHTGVWKNGVSIFNAKDGMSYNNMGVWYQDAYVFEGSSFDDCLGHPAQNGEYHHHVNPTCLYSDDASSIHSPIIGYALDGFPIYGAYSTSNPNGTGDIIRMTSGYQLRDIENRQTLSGGVNLNPVSYGPSINAAYPLGSFLEDYEFVSGSGTLDEHNGRVCVTPEYPAGIYAYFVTIDENLDPVYPYVLGPKYYGLVQSGNTGPQSAHNVIPSGAENYDPSNSVFEIPSNILHIYPNPTSGIVHIIAEDENEVYLIDVLGRSLMLTVSEARNLDTRRLNSGVYLVKSSTQSSKLIIE